MIGKINNALYGVKLNTQDFLFFTQRCLLTDNTLLKTMPNIDQALQFIDVMNLVDVLLHLSHLL